MPTWLIVLISVLGGMVLLLFIILFGLYMYSFYSPKKGQGDHLNLGSHIYKGYEDEVAELIKGIMARPYEVAFIKSFDGLKLHARIYENKNSKKVALLCHGYRGTPYRDFSGGATEMINLGYNVILIDERAHGQSEGHSITFGVRESKDVLKWIDYAKERFGQDIELVLVGISMGGAIVLMIADQVSNVKIIADSPYSYPKAIISESIRSIKLPPSIVYPLMTLSCLVFGHTNLNKLSAFDAIKNTTNKILIIHGDSDTVVPHKISYALYEAYKDKIQYELFPGADHGFSYIIDKPRYQRILKEFLSK